MEELILVLKNEILHLLNWNLIETKLQFIKGSETKANNDDSNDSVKMDLAMERSPESWIVDPMACTTMLLQGASNIWSPQLLFVA